MAIIEICDICKKEVTKTDGITLECSDMDGLGFFGNDLIRAKKITKLEFVKNV